MKQPDEQQRYMVKASSVLQETFFRGERKTFQLREMLFFAFNYAKRVLESAILTTKLPQSQKQISRLVYKSACLNPKQLAWHKLFQGLLQCCITMCTYNILLGLPLTSKLSTGLAVWGIGTPNICRFLIRQQTMMPCNVWLKSAHAMHIS